MQDLGFIGVGLVVGFAVGATGVGGGSLMTPLLIVFYGISPILAVGTDLLYASVTKAFAVTLHGRHGSVDWPLVGLQALGSVPGVLIALWWLHAENHPANLSALIKLVVSVAVLVTATFMLFQEPVLHRLQRNRSPSSGLPRSCRRYLTIGVGFFIGLVVTVSSVGAGVIGLMLLMLLYPRHEAIRLVGSDLAHAVLVTAIAGLGHAAYLGSVDCLMLGALLMGGLPGIWLGTRIGFRLDSRLLKRILAVLLIFIGASTLARAALAR